MHEIKLPYAEIVRRRELLQACQRLQNHRPLAHIFADPPFYCRLAGIPIEQTYDDPRAMVLSQILGWKRILETVDCDVPGVDVGLVFGSFLTASAYGCRVVPQPGAIPGFESWFKDAADLPKLQALDPFVTGYHAVEVDFYHRIKGMADEFPVSYQGGEVDYPARRASLSTYSEGPFTIAGMIAGFDQMCLWCYEDPDLVDAIIDCITAKEIDRISRCWREMATPPGVASLADDYSPYLSTEMYQRFVLPSQKRMRDAFGKRMAFHSCISESRLAPFWKNELNIEVLNGFKPRSGLGNLERCYRPISDLFADQIVLEPDFDGANMMIATSDQIAQATQQTMQLFGRGLGLKIGATLSGGHNPDDMAKMSVIKQTILALSDQRPTN